VPQPAIFRLTGAASELRSQGVEITGFSATQHASAPQPPPRRATL